MLASSAWLTPEGIMALATLLALLLSIAKNLAQASGRKTLAAQLGAAEAQAAAMGKVAGTLVKGVERVKREGRLEPKVITQLVETLREENLLGGVEHLVKPIVEDARAAPLAPAEAVVARAATRIARKDGGVA